MRGAYLLRKTIFTFLGLLLSIAAYGQNYTGLIYTAADIAFVKSKINNAEEPWTSAYQQLIAKANGYAPSTHHAVATFHVPPYYNDPEAHNEAKMGLSTDAHAAYTNAIAYLLSDNETYAMKAIYFMNAWASNNTVVSTTHDSPLVAAYSGIGLLFGAELLMSSDLWPETQKSIFRTWVQQAYLPAVNTIKGRKNNWGDWGTLAVMASHYILGNTNGFNAEVIRVKGRIDENIANDGHLPEEVSRDINGLWYTYYTLTPMTLSAKAILNVNNENLFQWISPSGKSIKKALDYLFYYTNNKTEWPWYPITSPRPQTKEAPTDLFEAMNDYYNNAYINFSTPFRPIFGGYKDDALSHIPWTFPTLMKTTENNFEPFVPGNLVVSRSGNGQEALNTTTTASIHLDEYTPLGNKARSIPLPTTTMGINHRITSLGGFAYEGLLSLSEDGRYLAISGYDAASGITSPGSTVNRVVARIDAHGIVNTSTKFTTGSGNPRSVVTQNGTGFWLGVGGAGVRYAEFGATTGTTISTQPASSRSVSVFNGQLYAVTTTANMRVATVGVGLPTTTGQSLTALMGTVGTDANTNQFVMFDSDGNNVPDLMYTVNDGGTSPETAAIRKYMLESGSWVSKGTFSSLGITEGLKGIIGSTVGNGVTLYAVTMGNTATSTPSALLRIVDGDRTSNLATTIPVLTTLAKAPANTAFKGVAFAPKETTTPVSFGTFYARAEANRILLNWNTFSEYNNSHFEVLRSAEGRTFKVINRVESKGREGYHYTCTDYSPYSGVNYYQLKQVDKDGTSELLKTIVINAGIALEREKLNVFISPEGTLKVKINAASEGKGRFMLTGISGNKLLDATVMLKKGVNEFSFNIAHVPSGIYVTTLYLNEKNISVKLLRP